MSNLSTVYKDYIPLFNQCNIKNRPKIDLGNMLGEDGNINQILLNYNIGMKEQGFVQEANYWGNDLFLFNYRKLQKLNISNEQAMSFIFAMTNSNVELMIKMEEGQVPEEKYKSNKIKFENGKNCYGRSAVFYVNSETMQEIINDEGFEVLLEKDKLGMTPFDHWLLSGRNKAYVTGMMNLIINATEEEIKEVMNNTVFGYSVQDNIAAFVSKVGISNALYYTLLKSTEEDKENYINKYILDIFNILNKNFETVGNNKKEKESFLSAINNILGNIDDFKYLTEDNEKIKYIMENIEKKLENKLITSFGDKLPECKAIIEKRAINKILDVSPEIMNIKKSRRL